MSLDSKSTFVFESNFVKYKIIIILFKLINGHRVCVKLIDINYQLTDNNIFFLFRSTHDLFPFHMTLVTKLSFNCKMNY